MSDTINDITPDDMRFFEHVVNMAELTKNICNNPPTPKKQITSDFMFLNKSISDIDDETVKKLQVSASYFYFPNPYGMQDVLDFIYGENIPYNLESYTNASTTLMLIFDKNSVKKMKEQYGDEFYTNLVKSNILSPYPVYVSETHKYQDTEILQLLINYFTTKINKTPKKFKKIIADKISNNNQLLVYTLLIALCNKIPFDDQSIPEKTKQDINIMIANIICTLLKHDWNNHDENSNKIFIENTLCKLLIPDCIINDFTKDFENYGKFKSGKDKCTVITIENGNFIQHNFFDLDSNTKYTICHDIDVSKTKQPFDFSNITIHGCFSCSGVKHFIKLPHEISGKLDCSHIKNIVDTNGKKIDFITPTTKFPEGTTSVDLTYTINDFSALLSISFPKTLKKIIVQTSLLNKVNDKNPDIQNQACEFIKKHPNIIITDGKKTLQNIFDEANKQIDTIVPQKTSSPVSSIILEKNTDWLNRNEIIAKLRAEKNELIESIPDDKILKRYVQQCVNKNKSTISVETFMQNGQPVPCVKSDDYEKMYNLIIEYIGKDKQTEPEQNIPTQKSIAIKQDVSVQKTKETILIEKYINPTVWDDIKKSVSKSDTLTLLKNVQKINLAPSLQGNLGKVTFINDANQESNEASLKLKNVACFCQSPSGNAQTGRKRIIWSIIHRDNNVYFAAIAFLENHLGSKKHHTEYKKLQDYAKKQLDKNGYPIKLESYLNVSDLIAELEKSNQTTINIEHVDADTTNDLNTSDIQPTSQQDLEKNNTADTDISNTLQPKLPEQKIITPQIQTDNINVPPKNHRPRIEPKQYKQPIIDPLGDRAVQSSDNIQNKQTEKTQERKTMSTDFIHIQSAADLNILKIALEYYIAEITNEKQKLDNQLGNILSKSIDNTTNTLRYLLPTPEQKVRNYHFSSSEYIITALNLWSENLIKKFKEQTQTITIDSDLEQLEKIKAENMRVKSLLTKFSNGK